MQVILGSGGAIGTELAKILPAHTKRIRLVSRNPKKVNPGDELFLADLTRSEDALKAVEGATIAYLTVGLEYRAKVWESLWPLVMKNVIDACVAHKCKLVFFDNIYMYSEQNLNPIVESLPMSPPSRKGKIRKHLVEMIAEAEKKRGLIFTIARSADFYGPSIEKNSILTETVFKPLSRGKNATWLCSTDFKHSFTFVPDAAKATAMLGNSEKANGEVWHLPTAKNPPTGKEWIQMIADQMNVKPKYTVVSKGMVNFLGLFVPILRESKEMLYQYDRDYVFNSEKFENEFNFQPTSYIEGIQQIIKADYQ